MYTSDEQKREALKAFVVAKIREQIKLHQEIGTATGDTAKAVWEALRDSPTWSIVEGPKPNEGEHPRDPDWREPEEVWRMVPEILRPEVK
jgi:hypothetical protein